MRYALVRPNKLGACNALRRTGSPVNEEVSGIFDSRCECDCEKNFNVRAISSEHSKTTRRRFHQLPCA